MIIRRRLLAAIIFCLCLGGGGFAACAAPAVSPLAKMPWVWDILVIPPDDGWDKDEGTSVERTLRWYQAEISEKTDGIKGHDINFIFLPPLTEESAAKYKFPKTDSTVAIFSFASDEVNKLLAGKIAADGVPLLLSGGERVFFFNKGHIVPYLFALDLFRDYRCRAFADYALKTIEHRSRLGIIGTRFTLNEEREAKICFDIFSDENFMPMPYWLDASASDSFGVVEQEIKNYGSGVLISYVGGMASKEIWRNIMVGYKSPYRLWYGGAPDKSFLSLKGMVFADQNIYLDARGDFEQLKRNLWSSRIVSVPDKVAAGRAYATAYWLIEALTALPQNTYKADIKTLIFNLENTRGIPFGNQTLDIDKDTHRPALRNVYMLEVRNKNFFLLDTLNVRGLKYYDY